MGTTNKLSETNERQYWLVSLCYGIFAGWTLSFTYQGPIFFALANSLHFDGTLYNQLSVFFVSAGMFTAAFAIRNWRTARNVMRIGTCTSVFIIILMPLLPIRFLLPLFLALAFFSGVFAPAWGHFFFYNIKKENRGKAVADVLIIGNIVLSLSALCAVYFNIAISMGYLMLLLIATYFISSRLTVTGDDALKTTNANKSRDILLAAVAFLIFIFLISFTAGIMFSVVFPSFVSFTLMTTLYPNLPYTLPLLVLRFMPQNRNRNFTLYMGMSILGFAYILFAFLGSGPLKFFLVMTPMMIAYGIFDYFWWRMMGDFSSYGPTPGFTVGISLSVNVIGVFFGSAVSHRLLTLYKMPLSNMSFIALAFISIVIGLLPLLNRNMGKIFADHVFFLTMTAPPATAPRSDDWPNEKASQLLTAREMELVTMVLAGHSYRTIAEMLYISENTVKTHAKNIYKKLEINSKYELMRYFTPNPTETNAPASNKPTDSK
jgi:DNA-binding CsgD family transcriptional regulator